MAVTITRTQIRQEMLKRAPILGRALTADSITKAGPSLTHVAEYERQRAGLTSFESQYIHRYNLADPQRWRLITTLDSGATNGIINLDGPAYTDNTDLAYERLTIHPDDLNFAIAEGQRRQRTRTNIALVRGGLDLDMELGNVNFWDGTSGNSSKSNVTVTKDVAVAFSGTRSLNFAATGASPYTRSGIIRVTPGRLIYVAAIVISGLQPVTFTLYDYLNSAVIQSVTLSAPLFGGWTVMYIQAQVPANCGLVQLMFSSTSATANFWVDTCFGPYQSGQTEYLLQSGIDEAYKLRFVRPSQFVSPQQTSGCADADSLSYIGDLVRPDDWDMEVFRRDVNSNRLRFQANSYNNNNIGWGLLNGGPFMQSQMRPIWLAMEAKVSDFEPLLTEVSTTTQPLDECACYSLRYLAETENQRDPGNPVWANMLQEYKAWAVIEDMGRPPQAMYKPQRFHQIRA